MEGLYRLLTPLSGWLEPLLEWIPCVGAPLSDMNTITLLSSIPLALRDATTSPTDRSRRVTIPETITIRYTRLSDLAKVQESKTEKDGSKTVLV